MSLYFAIGLVAFQFLARILARPFVTFALRGPLLMASMISSISIVASLIVASDALAYALQSVSLFICGAIIVFPRMRRVAAKREAAAVVGAIVLVPPFDGRWISVAAGPDPLLNHHLAASDQIYACDFVRTSGSFGQPILSPGDGVVVSARDGMPDRPPSRNPDDPSVRGKPFGNHVVLKIGGAYVFLCHLRQNTICVKAGSKVASGEKIGECGNSGRTTMSHLHIHAQKTPDPAPFKAIGLPICFKRADGSMDFVVTGDSIEGVQ